MSAGLEIKNGLFTPGFHHRVVIAGGADRDALVRQVGEVHEEIPHPGVELIRHGFQDFDLLVDFLHLLDERLGLVVEPSLFLFPHLFRQSVPLVPQFIQAGQGGPALTVFGREFF